MTISLGMPTMPPTAPDGVGNLRARERFQQAARHDLKKLGPAPQLADGDAHDSR